MVYKAAKQHRIENTYSSAGAKGGTRLCIASLLDFALRLSRRSAVETP